MSTSTELWPTVSGSNVLIWAAMDKIDSSKRVALYKNRSGITGKMSVTQLAALGQTIESLPVVKSAAEVAAALRAGYPANFRWDYFDFILSSTSESQSAAMEEAITTAVDNVIADVTADIDTKVSRVFRFKGSVSTLADLPLTGNIVGDVYQVQEDNYSEYCWIDGEEARWEYLGKIIDLTPYATIEYADGKDQEEKNARIAADAPKVDKVTGKSLISDTEIERLAAVSNYDDVAIKERVSAVEAALPTKVDNVDGKELSSNDFTSDEKNKLASLSNFDASNLEAAIALKADASALTNKVDKIENKSLVDDTEIARLVSVKKEEVIFIKSATTQSLVIDTWYIASAALTGNLPEAPVNGTSIKVSVVGGGEATTLVPAGTDTISGATAALAISTANDTVIVVYDSEASNWVVL